MQNQDQTMVMQVYESAIQKGDYVLAQSIAQKQMIIAEKAKNQELLDFRQNKWKDVSAQAVDKLMLDEQYEDAQFLITMIMAERPNMSKADYDFRNAKLKEARQNNTADFDFL